MDEIRSIRLKIFSDPDCGLIALSRIRREHARHNRDRAARIRELARIVRYEAANTRERSHEIRARTSALAKGSTPSSAEP